MNMPSLYQPQADFVQSFLRPEQIQRMLIYFSKQKPTDLYSREGFSDVVVRLINDPLTIIFGEHGVYLFSNYLLVYPYNELDPSQLAYITQFLSMHVPDLTPADNTERGSLSIGQEKSSGLYDVTGNTAAPVKIDVRITKQMGGGFTVRPIQLTNIRLRTLDVLCALVRGVMQGDQKHSVNYRQHAVNLQLQRILTRIVVSRSELHAVNLEIELYVTKENPEVGSSADASATSIVACA